MSKTSSSEEWTTRLGVILAVAGSAVGLGNFLRFPGNAAQNGGGAFMIPYFIAFLLLGIPICWAEWTMGRMGGKFGFNSAPAIYGAVGKSRVWRYLGVIGVLIPLIIYIYYVVIESWCLAYAVNYALGAVDLGTDQSQFSKRSGEFFSQLVGSGSDGAMLNSSSVYAWIFVFAVNFYFIYRGLSRGIENFCKYAVPMMSICALIVLVRVLTLGTPNPDFPERSVLNGLGFMWNPKSIDGNSEWYSTLFNPQVWLAATGQIFFSLSVGFGIIVNYASYLKRKDDVILSGLTASSTNEFFEVCLGGLITIPAAFIFLGAAGATGSTFGVGFNTLPVVFEYMPGGRFFGFLWFFMLFLAAITSSLSMLQPAIAFLEEAIGIGRKASVVLLGMITALGSLFVIYFSKDLVALDTMDFWVGTAMIYVLATLQVILFAWILGVDKGVKEGEEGADMKFPRIFPFVIKYISPTYLLLVFVAWCIDSFPKKACELIYYAGCGDLIPGTVEEVTKNGVPLLSVALILVVFLFLLMLVAIARPRWDAKEKEMSV